MSCTCLSGMAPITSDFDLCISLILYRFILYLHLSLPFSIQSYPKATQVSIWCFRTNLAWDLVHNSGFKTLFHILSDVNYIHCAYWAMVRVSLVRFQTLSLCFKGSLQASLCSRLGTVVARFARDGHTGSEEGGVCRLRGTGRRNEKAAVRSPLGSPAYITL